MTSNDPPFPTSEVLQIRTVQDGPQLELVRALFVEYQKSLGISLCFQDFDEELRTLPGRYALPAGRLYLGLMDDVPGACAAIRPLANGMCEAKRLFVRERYRALGFARMLMKQAIIDARAMGYTHMLLDTLPEMVAAQTLYQSLGFVDIDAYTENPIKGTRFMQLSLGIDR